MSTPQILLTQVVISLLVVALYHRWASRNKPPAPPVPHLNPNLLSVSRATQPAPPASASPATPVLAVPVPAVVAVPIPPPPKTLPAAEQTPPEILAVIAAAITVVLGRPHRVVSVEQAAYTPEVNVWALEGRMKHFMSHKIR